MLLKFSKGQIAPGVEGSGSSSRNEYVIVISKNEVTPLATQARDNRGTFLKTICSQIAKTEYVA